MERNYVFIYPSSLEHYIAKAYTVRCVDDRFRDAFEKFLPIIGIDLRSGHDHIDPKSPTGGGIKVFASPDKESDREYSIRELEASIALHHPEKILLFSHTDCGMYGTLKRFNGDKDKELEFHVAEHKKAREFLRTRFPNFVVESYFIDEKGIIKIQDE